MKLFSMVLTWIHGMLIACASGLCLYLNLVQCSQQPRRLRYRRIVASQPRFRAKPKPRWMRDEVARLKALMPEAGCRTVAHVFIDALQRRRT